MKLSKVTNLSDDIALALGASGVRIAPVPNKISAVGIEAVSYTHLDVYKRPEMCMSSTQSSRWRLT